MKRKINLSCIVFTLMLAGYCSVYGQIDTQVIYRIYATQWHDLQVSRDKNLIDSLENEIANIQVGSEQSDFNFELKFHVLLKESVINDEIIRVQIEVLNRAFQEIDRDKFIQNENLSPFYELTDVPNFKFCNSMSNSYFTADSSYHINSEDFHNLLKISPLFDGKRTINIYVVDLKNNATGFATLPHVKNGLDIIVIDRKFFGIHHENLKDYNQGKTLVHLMASFLGLNELWNENEYCKDDLVDDTPIHNYANFSPGSELKNVSTCDGNPIENIVNYMDNLPDKYSVMFTKGQVERLKKVCLAKYGRQSYNSVPCDLKLQNRIGKDLEITIYPNPNNGLLFVSSNKPLNNVDIKIYNYLGHQVHYAQIGNIGSGARVDINLQNLHNGMYTILIYSDAKLVKQENIIKN